jgi:hypothetical protein
MEQIIEGGTSISIIRSDHVGKWCVFSSTLAVGLKEDMSDVANIIGPFDTKEDAILFVMATLPPNLAGPNSGGMTVCPMLCPTDEQVKKAKEQVKDVKLSGAKTFDPDKFLSSEEQEDFNKKLKAIERRSRIGEISDDEAVKEIKTLHEQLTTRMKDSIVDLPEDKLAAMQSSLMQAQKGGKRSLN